MNPKRNLAEMEAVAKEIVDSAIKVHRALGPGLLESAYQQCLAFELHERGLKVECEVPIPVIYQSHQIDVGYRIDMLVDGCIIVENKAVDQIIPIHEAQLLTYLKLSNLQLGFLLNWNVLLMRQGIRRMVNNLGGAQNKERQVKDIK
ncbi:MAG: GxxExxY protein [Anaerolineae bacterium]